MISFGRCSLREPLDLLHVDGQVLAPHVVGDDLVELARDVQLHPVREVAAVVERHAHDLVAGLEQRHVDGVVGLGARVRLHVRVLGAEQLLGAVDRELLGDVHLLAAAVVAAARVALGVLVGEHRARRLEHGLGDEVLRGDHLQRVLLAAQLALEHLGDLGVHLGQRRGLEVVGQLSARASDDTSGPGYGLPRWRSRSRAGAAWLRGARRGRRGGVDAAHPPGLRDDDAGGSGSRAGHLRGDDGVRRWFDTFSRR